MSSRASLSKWISWEGMGINRLVGSLLSGLAVASVVWTGSRFECVTSRCRQLSLQVSAIWKQYKCPILISLGCLGFIYLNNRRRFHNKVLLDKIDQKLGNIDYKL